MSIEKLLFWRKVSNYSAYTCGVLLIVDIFFIKRLFSNIYLAIIETLIIITFLIAELMKVITKRKNKVQ